MKIGILVVLSSVAGLALWLGCGGVELDRSIPAQPGGKLSVEVTLGSGFAFDKGSLTVSSHERDEVRVVVDTSGWGEYAVEVDIREVAGGVEVEGRVDGLLHWLFGGPTVDLQVWVPADYSLDASIQKGPLLIEDVTGPIKARIEGSELTLRRAEGGVDLIATGGPILVEDVEGTLELETRDGDVDVSGVRGDLRIRSRHGRVEVSSVTGRLDVASLDGKIEIDRVDGDARVSSENGRIEIRELRGNLEVKTGRGRIEVEDIEGSIFARSGRGGIEVRFADDPAGLIETQRGSIEVEVPYESQFDLVASASRGRVELDSDLEFAHRLDAKTRADPAQSLANLGERIAADVTAQVHENLQRGFATGDWDFDWDFEWDFRFDDDSAHREWRKQGESRREARARRWRESPFGRGFGQDSVEITGTVNGGETLRLRTERGSIQIDDR